MVKLWYGYIVLDLWYAAFDIGAFSTGSIWVIMFSLMPVPFVKMSCNTSSEACFVWIIEDIRILEVNKPSVWPC